MCGCRLTPLNNVVEETRVVGARAEKLVIEKTENGFELDFCVFWC